MPGYFVSLTCLSSQDRLPVSLKWSLWSLAWRASRRAGFARPKALPAGGTAHAQRRRPADVGHAGYLAEAYGPRVAYNIPAESQRLIVDGLPDRPVRLSRRRRFAPVAVDVDGDIACTRFVRRGVGCFWDETHLLARDDNGWRLLGGGGASSGELWSTNEFEQARDQLSYGHVQVEGGPSVRCDPGRRLPWGAHWVHAAKLLVNRSVAVVVVDARRRLPVPYHGRLVVVWASRRPPWVSARDAAGHELTSVALPAER